MIYPIGISIDMFAQPDNDSVELESRKGLGFVEKTTYEEFCFNRLILSVGEI